MKTCVKCKLTLQLDKFYKKIGNRDGVQNWCKTCDNKRHKKWRRNNPERTREMSKEQRERNPEKMRAFVREYARKHPEVRRKAVEKWSKFNKHKISAQRKLQYAVKVGKIKRKVCFCGKKAQAHHEDYTKPLDVMWLCNLHHKARHMELDKLCKNIKS